MIDYHIHTVFSCDSHLKPEMVCNHAIERGFYEIAFTEHLDLDPRDDGYGYYNYDDITEKVSELKSQYNGRLKIKKGVEITYQKEREDEIRRFLNDKDYDFIIGSVHLVNNFDVSHDEGTVEFFKRLDRKRAFLSYFEVTLDLVNSGIFDCLGHFEMIRRYALKYIADYSYEEFKKSIDEILKTIKKKRIALEVNTSGIRHLPKETYPRMEIVRRFLDLRGKYFTIGSDAHLPEHIGYMIPETMELLQSIGVEEVTLFSNQEKTFYKMERASNIITK